jgi:hypothetical protein
LQEELGRNLDEIIVTASEPAKISGRARKPPVPAAVGLSVRSSGTGSPRLEAARAPRRTWPFYAATGGLILGLACGLWLASRRVPAPAPARPQAAAVEAAAQTEPAAFSETSSAVEAARPPADDSISDPAGAENPATAATPAPSDERAPRLPAAGVEAPGRAETGVRPSASAARPDAPAAREQRQGGGRCTLSVSKSSLSLRAGGGSDNITVGVDDATNAARVTAATNHWPDIAVFKSRGDGGGRVRFSVISVSKRAGTFAVNFKSPCGVRSVPVTVRQP